MFADSTPTLKFLTEAVEQSAYVLARAPYWQRGEAKRVHAYNVRRLESALS